MISLSILEAPGTVAALKQPTPAKPDWFTQKSSAKPLAALRHFVKRALRPQVRHYPNYLRDDVLYLLCGVEAAKTEADAAVGQLVLDAHRSQDVTRLRIGLHVGRPGAEL